MSTLIESAGNLLSALAATEVGPARGAAIALVAALLVLAISRLAAAPPRANHPAG